MRMLKWFFRLYENNRIRNTFYSFAFALVGLIGGYFAYLVWGMNSSTFNHVLVVIGGVGMFILATTIICRFVFVPPTQTEAEEGGVTQASLPRSDWASAFERMGEGRPATSKKPIIIGK